MTTEPSPMPDERRTAAEAARGFMPVDEGLALYGAAASVATTGPFLEIGSYCGKSGVYLGTAAETRSTILYGLDHHRGSEENQAGWEHHDADLVDSRINKWTLFRCFVTPFTTRDSKALS